MIAFLTLLYVGLLALLVKHKLIKLTPFWKVSPLLWVTLLLIVLFIPMQWGAPSGPVRTFNPIIEIVPNVTGEVVDVPVKPLNMMKKGDVLFQIDPVPYRAVVDQKRAVLAEARQVVPQLKAGLGAAVAAVAEARANRDRTKDEYSRYARANENARRRGRGRSAPFTKKDVEQRRLVFLSAEAAFKRALADRDKAGLAYKSQIDGKNTTVALREAELRNAEYDLAQTTVRAPADGYVLGLTLQPGQRVSNLPVRSWLAFAPVSQRRIIVSIPQSRMRHVSKGQKAEIAFAVRPGEIIGAEVESIVRINSSGQLPPSGIVPSLSILQGPNEQMGVALRLKNPQPDPFTLPGGADGTAAIYTDSVKATHLIRRVMIRMESWLNYIVPN